MQDPVSYYDFLRYIPSYPGQFYLEKKIEFEPIPSWFTVSHVFGQNQAKLILKVFYHKIENI